MGRTRQGFWTRLAISIVKPPTMLLTRHRWSGQEHVPATGPAILAANHISYLDPFPLAHFVYDAGRIPRDGKPQLLPPHVVQITAGAAMDLSDYAVRPDPTGQLLREVTDRITGRIRELVGELRGETPPVEVFDPRPEAPVVDQPARWSA